MSAWQLDTYKIYFWDHLEGYDEGIFLQTIVHTY
jgi:hypothetical protein